MVEKRKLICISCPVGCELTVTIDEDKIIDVEDEEGGERVEVYVE